MASITRQTFDIDERKRFRFETSVFDEVTKKHVLTDTAIVELEVKKPDTTTTTYTLANADISNPSIGVYYYDLLFDLAGIWYFKWKATGVVNTAHEGEFSVNASQF